MLELHGNELSTRALYDRIADPTEVDNLVKRPESQATIEAMLAHLWAERGEIFAPDASPNGRAEAAPPAGGALTGRGKSPSLRASGTAGDLHPPCGSVAAPLQNLEKSNREKPRWRPHWRSGCVRNSRVMPGLFSTVAGPFPAPPPGTGKRLPQRRLPAERVGARDRPDLDHPVPRVVLQHFGL